MSKIISVSRRTDIPAFYGEWFMDRLRQGFAGWENPFGGQKYLVSLKPGDVLALAFWSKNYRPFLEPLRDVKKRGYRCIFNYTITGLPNHFECNLVETDDAIDSFIEISRMFSPEHIGWRYDPIVVSDVTGSRFHLEKFEYIASRLAKYTKRCFLSYAITYGKVARNFKKFTDDTGIGFYDPTEMEKIKLANMFSDIARKYGIQVYTCCGDYLINDKIFKAHCLDGDLISDLYFEGNWKGQEKPTRKECGCTVSTDIGKYDTCPHGCIYCYANVNKERAVTVNAAHDSQSIFLGYSKVESETFASDLSISVEKPKKVKTKDVLPCLPGLESF